MAAPARTYLAFQHNAKLNTVKTFVTAIRSFDEIEQVNQQLFKQGCAQDHVVVTQQTIFHPQGGGQPSDLGLMLDQRDETSFAVAAVRMDAIRDGQVLHFGSFKSSLGAPGIFEQGEMVEHRIDVEQRFLYSRLHTAGHVLGAAVRQLLQNEIEGFDELKASHFPDSAACEFQGLIEAKWKDPIQKKVDEYVAAKLPIEIYWWDEPELARLVRGRSLAPPGEKFRVVKIIGAEVYPCGGTHVDSTDLCGKVRVKKISRSKGQSRVSYALD